MADRTWTFGKRDLPDDDNGRPRWRPYEFGGSRRRYGTFFKLSWPPDQQHSCFRCKTLKASGHGSIGFDPEFVALAVALRARLLELEQTIKGRKGGRYAQLAKAQSDRAEAPPGPTRGMMALARIRGKHWLAYSGTPKQESWFAKLKPKITWTVGSSSYECTLAPPLVYEAGVCQGVDIRGHTLEFKREREGSTVHVERKLTGRGFRDCDGTPLPLECAGTRVLVAAFAEARAAGGLGDIGEDDRLVELWLGDEGVNNFNAYTHSPAPPCNTCRQVLPALMCKYADELGHPERTFYYRRTDNDLEG